jgi:hypothetical protein
MDFVTISTFSGENSKTTAISERERSRPEGKKPISEGTTFVTRTHKKESLVGSEKRSNAVNKTPISIHLCEMTIMGTSGRNRNEQSGLFVDSHAISQGQSDQRSAFIDP